jgi:hypothetical protein
MEQKNYIFTGYVSNDTVGFDVKITLNDECKNGHSDFHITGTMYDLTKDKTPSRKNEECSGSIGKEIVKHFPQFAIFEKLHGNDFEGTPFGAITDSFFYMNDKKAAMRHLNVTSEEFCALQLAYFDEDKTYFHFLCQHRLDLPTRWKTKATKAIEWLEENAQQHFDTSHGVGRFKPLLQDEIDVFIQRENEGYYTAENVELRRLARLNEKKNALIDKINATYDSKVTKAKQQKMFDLAIANFFGEEVCVIYYDHTNTYKFNWFGSHNHVTPEEITAFVESKPKIPKGAKLA